jgi:tetratricopeptide (TPR) repeat protein
VQDQVCVEEILTIRREREDPAWPQSANLLGDAFRERADLELALDAYRQALHATAVGREERLTYAIDLANALRALPLRSGQQLDELIGVQDEILTVRREREDPAWPQSANLLGDALGERAGRRDDETAKLPDLELALEAYRQAFDATPANDRRRLLNAIVVGNLLIMRAAISRSGDARERLQEATTLVSEALAKTGIGDHILLRNALPVLRASLTREIGQEEGRVRD